MNQLCCGCTCHCVMEAISFMWSICSSGLCGILIIVMWFSDNSSLPASGILNIVHFSSPSSRPFPKSHPMCLSAAPRLLTLLTLLLPLWFRPPLVPSPLSSSSLPAAISPPHFTRHRFIFTLSSYHPSHVGTTSADQHNLYRLPAGPAPIIPGIDLWRIDER